MSAYLSHFLGIGIPAAFIFSCFGPYRRWALAAQKLHSSLHREIGLHAFVLCLFGLSFSLGTECCQFFLGYHCDVDDILLNVMGVALGYGLCRLLKSLFPPFTEKFLCQNK